MGEGSNAWSFPENNNRMTAFQRSGDNSSKEGQVSLEYFAHSSFRITSPGGMTIVIDPWRNDPSGAWGQWFPEEYRRRRRSGRRGGRGCGRRAEDRKSVV